jgi:hypothetical protein
MRTHLKLFNKCFCNYCNLEPKHHKGKRYRELVHHFLNVVKIDRPVCAFEFALKSVRNYCRCWVLGKKSLLDFRDQTDFQGIQTWVEDSCREFAFFFVKESKEM